MVCLIVYQYFQWLSRMVGGTRFLVSLSALGMVIGLSLPALATTSVASSITYATRIDAVVWDFEGSKFSCQISHTIDEFGTATFERQAGMSTRFVLSSQSPRMKSGKADLLSQPPSWLSNESSAKIALVNVRHGETPISIKRKISERMLAELHKGMDLHLVRQPWYGDKQSLKVVVPSVGFRKTYNEYLGCLGSLLPVNFSQIERKSLQYSNGDEDLTKKAKRYLEKVAIYIKEDPSVKAIYIDGHTDSVGIRNDNLLKSKMRTEMVVDFLVEYGVSKDIIFARWHGERYQIATNQTNAGKAKNRRVTIRLSKDAPQQEVTKVAEAPEEKKN